jgi:hypothetical protein
VPFFSFFYSLGNVVSDVINNSEIVRLLASENQNTVGQIIISISQQFNKINNENIDKAVSSK